MAVRDPGGGSSWNLAFCGPKNVLQRLHNIKCFWKKNPINFRVQISPRAKTMHNAWIYCYFHDLCAKKMFEQKRFAGRHLLTFESQKLNYFGKKGGPFWHYNVIRIWAMSGPFSRLLVIFYPLSPRTPF